MASARLLRHRWQVKFFKIGHAAFASQSVYGMTKKEVMTYIWIAIAGNVLVGILKKHLNLGISLYAIQEINTHFTNIVIYRRYRIRDRYL